MIRRPRHPVAAAPAARAWPPVHPPGLRFPVPPVVVEPAADDLSDLPGRYMNPGELARLVTLVRSVAPRSMVEFGCNEGRTAAALLRTVPTLAHYCGVDVEPGYVPAKAVQRNEVPPRPGYHARHDGRFDLVLRPRGAFDLTADDLPAADVVFIDGDHSRAAVLNDWALACAVIRPGGIVIFHDDNGLPVVDVTATLDELFAAGAPVQHVAESWLAVVRFPAARVLTFAEHDTLTRALFRGSRRIDPEGAGVA